MINNCDVNIIMKSNYNYINNLIIININEYN